MGNLLKLKKELREIAESERAEVSKRFFKTGKGEYGEGDEFLGLSVPQRRKLAKKYKDLKLTDVLKLLHSKIHEERSIALFILVDKFESGGEKERKEIYNLYLRNTKYVNNWDLVDSSADKIVGGYLYARQPRTSDDAQFVRGPAASFPPASASGARPSKLEERSGVGSPSSGVTPHILLRLTRSENLWERRIAIVATYQFIKNNRFDATLKIAEMLLRDQHDLIHKAVGWMLREVGKRDLKAEEKFLKKYYKQMPRTMLRYAIEKFPENLKLVYLFGRI